MTLERRLAAVAAAALLAVGGCTGTDDPGPTSSPTASPSPAATATPQSESERAAAEAEAFVPDYYRVLDEIRRDPAKDAAPLEGVSTGTDLDTWRTTFGEWKRDGWTMTGESVPAEVVIQTVTPDGTTVQLDVCVDVSAVDVVDASGTSVVLPERPDRTWERLTLARPAGEDDAWRVSDRKTLEQEPCEVQ